MSFALILVAAVTLPILMIGLPLLLKPESPIPDIVGFTLLAVLVLYCAWDFGNWWMLAPNLALVALVLWLDRKEEAPAQGGPAAIAAGMSGRSRTHFRLWRASHYVNMALVASILLAFATGFMLVPGRLLLPCLLTGTVAAQLFRFSLVRSLRRDRHDRRDLRDRADPPVPASSAGFG